MPASDAVVQNLFTGIDLTGVLANAMLGGAIARDARLDPVGFATLAILSGLGGGLIRDTLLQHGTPVALTSPAYIPTALAGAMLAYFLRVEGRVWNYAFPFVDALALGCWAATGAQRTLADGLAWLPAVLLGTITAVGGGMTRDIFLRRIPQIFGGNTLYATSAVLASGVMVVLYKLGHASLGLILATLTGAGLTLLARWRGVGTAGGSRLAAAPGLARRAAAPSPRRETSRTHIRQGAVIAASSQRRSPDPASSRH